MTDNDLVFKALADRSRRKLLDLLNANDVQTLSQLCEHLDMTRQAVTQHLAVLESAHLEALYNYVQQDPGVSEREGVSVFIKAEPNQIFHTYSTYARGIDIVNTAYHYLDLVPKGRDENGRAQFWVKRRDEYASANATGNP